MTHKNIGKPEQLLDICDILDMPPIEQEVADHYLLAAPEPRRAPNRLEQWFQQKFPFLAPPTDTHTAEHLL